MEHKLGLGHVGDDDPIAGFCGICGFGESYVGHKERKELEEAGIKINDTHIPD